MNEEKLLFDYFLNRLADCDRGSIKTSKDLIKVYECYIIKDCEDNCSSNYPIDED